MPLSVINCQGLYRLTTTSLPRNKCNRLPLVPVQTCLAARLGR